MALVVDGLQLTPGHVLRGHRLLALEADHVGEEDVASSVVVEHLVATEERIEHDIEGLVFLAGHDAPDLLSRIDRPQRTPVRGQITVPSRRVAALDDAARVRWRAARGDGNEVD